MICVVEEPGDVIPIERTHEYRGRYHVLGGALSPIDGVDPDDLKIAELYARVADQEPRVTEVVLATNPTTTGEATALHIAAALRERAPDVTVTRLASGLPVGGDLEYADEVTLGRALAGRRAILGSLASAARLLGDEPAEPGSPSPGALGCLGRIRQSRLRPAAAAGRPPAAEQPRRAAAPLGTNPAEPSSSGRSGRPPVQQKTASAEDPRSPARAALLATCTPMVCASAWLTARAAEPGEATRRRRAGGRPRRRSS